MYAYFHGRLVSKKPAEVVIDVGGVAYRLFISLSTFEALPSEGAEATVHTHLKVSENAMTLYGFATVEERRIFLDLIEGVSQLGPRRALAILSSAPVHSLREIVDAGDTKRLRRIKGIGPKMADKIVFELKGKLPKDAGMTPEVASQKDDAIHALVSLGYLLREAETAVDRALDANANSDGELSAEDLVKRSLRHV